MEKVHYREKYKDQYEAVFWRKFTDPLFEKTLLHIVPHFISPNQVSVLRFLSIVPVGYLLFVEAYFWGLIIFVASALTDAIDGAMARTRYRVTELGKVLDPIADRSLMIIAAIILIPRFFGWGLFVALVVLELFHTYFAWRVTIKLGRNPGSNWVGSFKMLVQSVALGLIFLGALNSSPGVMFWAGALFYASLALTFLQSFAYPKA